MLKSTITVLIFIISNHIIFAVDLYLFRLFFKFIVKWDLKRNKWSVCNSWYGYFFIVKIYFIVIYSDFRMVCGWNKVHVVNAMTLLQSFTRCQIWLSGLTKTTVKSFILCPPAENYMVLVVFSKPRTRQNQVLLEFDWTTMSYIIAFSKI